MKKQIYSFIFPILTMISGLLWLSNDFIIPATFIIASGLASVVLTILQKVDTSMYLKIRIIFFVISLFTFIIPLMLFNQLLSAAALNILLVWLIVAPCVAFIAELIVCAKLQLFNEPKTLAAILLSEPIVCNLIVLIYALVVWWVHGV